MGIQLGRQKNRQNRTWLTNEPEVAFVVFVRKRMPEIQYLRCTISDQQRQEFGALVKDTVAQIEAGSFLPHSGK
jgi:hypothetical protein